MTLFEFIKEFLESTKERLKTPISGAFLWAFVICNWRPIFLLIFSEASIENKIIVINHEYCTFWAIFWPIVFATFYILLIPKIMLMIEKDLAITVQERVTKRYEAEKHIVKQKVIVAKEEFILKSEESGNKTIKEFNDQIKALEDKYDALGETLKQSQESSKVTIDGLNNQLKNANAVMHDMQRQYRKSLSETRFEKSRNFIENNSQSFTTSTMMEMRETFDKINLDEFTFLDQIEAKDGKLEYTELKGSYDDFLRTLQDKGVLNLIPTSAGIQVYLTDMGKLIYSAIKQVS